MDNGSLKPTVAAALERVSVRRAASAKMRNPSARDVISARGDAAEAEAE